MKYHYVLMHRNGNVTVHGAYSKVSDAWAKKGRLMKRFPYCEVRVEQPGFPA